MRGVLPIAVLLGGCEPAGLTLDVTTDNPAVTKVELLVGMYCPDTCPERVAPPALAPRPVDRIFVVDDSSPWMADVDNGVAGFRLTANSVSAVGMLMAVGLDKDGQPIETAYAYDVEIPISRGDYVRVPLKATSPVALTLVEPPQPEGTEGLSIWREPRAQRACVLAEHWTGAPEPRRDLVVPADDPDCDEVETANECAPWTPLAMNAPSTIDNANCAFLGALSSGTSVCMFGGTPCNELGPTTTPQCTHLEANYCAPKPLCGSCSGTWQPDCATDVLLSGAAQNAFPHLACSFRITDDGMPCDDEVIVSNVDASALLGTQRVASCQSVGVHDLSAPFGPFESKVQTPTGLFKVDALTQPCSLDVHWKGSAVPAGAAPPASAVFVDLALDNTNHLALPAVIHLEVGCSAAPTCAVMVANTGDPMLECAQQRGTMTAICGPSGACPDGPACASGCCGQGEECVNGVCTCAGTPACTGGNVCTIGAATSDLCGSVCCGTTDIPCPF